MEDSIEMNVESESDTDNDTISILSTPEVCMRCEQIVYTELGIQMHRECHNLATSIVKIEKVCWTLFN